MKNYSTFKKISFNKNLCMTCHSCEIGCSTVHSSGRSISDAMNKKAVPRIRILFNAEKNTVLAEQCQHCKKARCIEACPEGALFHDDAGRVLCNVDKCNGCGACEEACPFHAIRVAGHCIKCDLCKDIPGIPACVAHCPVGALTVKEAGRTLAVRS